MITRISDSEKSHTLPPNLDKGALETGTMEGIFNQVPRDWIQTCKQKNRTMSLSLCNNQYRDLKLQNQQRKPQAKHMKSREQARCL